MNAKNRITQEIMRKEFFTRRDDFSLRKSRVGVCVLYTCIYITDVFFMNVSRSSLEYMYTYFRFLFRSF